MKLKKNFSVSPETDFEIRRLAKALKVSIGRAWEIAAHYTARGLSVGVEKETVSKIGDLRQAEAKVEMLKAK